ncbi:c-type cytochrome [Citreimonas salinaria]|uniref:Cytochrome c n=1 Tax=Citreimonas salinaria TaxID=321339 RepID=A0A1H3FFW3_9RHOB|nr:c-type cytochrome [Citreimonas salinaria]SDX89034.1 cytochrome c [Citreimonas salinaria]
MTLKIATIVTLAGLAAPAFAQDNGAAVTGDAAAGETVFNRCKACHQIVDDEGEMIVRGGRVGPDLYGLAGREAGSVEDFNYSDALVQAGDQGLVWEAETFKPFVLHPSDYLTEYLGETARSKMQPQRLDDEQLNDLWAYLSQFGAAEDAEGEAPEGS